VAARNFALMPQGFQDRPHQNNFPEKCLILAGHFAAVVYSFFARLRQEEKLRENNRICNAAVAMWLMTEQRLQGNATLESGVLELVRGLSARFRPRPSKRLLPGPEGQDPRLSTELRKDLNSTHCNAL
jgi:hypothetical protein